MKRIFTFILALVMLISSTMPVTAFAENEQAVTGSEMVFSEDNTFGKLLNTAMETEASAEDISADGDLPCLIQSFKIEGKTAVASITAPSAATLVVGLYDENDDTLLGSSVLDVAASEDAQDVTLQLNIETMPAYFRGKAFLLDSVTNEPLSQICCYEKSTKGYNDIAKAKATDFPAEQVLNLDEDLNTNFAVYKSDVIITDFSRVTDYGNGTYAIINATQEEKRLEPSKVFVASMPDGNLLIVKVHSISIQGNTVTITQDSGVQVEDVFELVKLDINSEDCGIEDARSNGVVPAFSSGNTPQISLLSDTNDPLNTTEWKITKDTMHLFPDKNNPTNESPFSLTVVPKITTQYYWSTNYEYCSIVSESEFIFKVDVNSGDFGEVEKLGKLIKWNPKLNIATGNPLSSVVIDCSITLEYEAGMSTYFSATVTHGKEYFHGTRKIYDLGKPVSLGSGAEIEGKFTFTVSAGIGMSFVSIPGGNAFLAASLRYKDEMTLASKSTITSDNEDKLHVCSLCLALEFSRKKAVVFDLRVLVFGNEFELIPLSAETKLCHRCFIHDKNDNKYPYVSIPREEAHNDFGECTRYAYKITFKAEDTEQNPLKGQQITLGKKNGGLAKVFAPNINNTFDYVEYKNMVTGDDGVYECYLENGDYQVTVNGSVFEFTVSGRPKEIALVGKGIPSTDDKLSLEIVLDSYSILVDSPISLKAILSSSASDAVDVTDSVKWHLEDPNIAEISDDGKTLTGKNKGSTSLSATYTGDENVYYDKVDINICDIIDQGTSSKISWVLDSDYTLTITGEGQMNSRPWSAYNVKIKRISIGQGITTICSNAFENCFSLETVSLPVSLTRINSKAFKDCVKLSSIYIPQNVSYIASDAFQGCTSLTNIVIDPENPYLKLVDGMLLCLSDDGTTLNSALVLENGVLRVPEGVEKIADYCSQGSNIVRLEIPYSVYYIGTSAFKDCTLLERVTTYQTEYKVPAASYAPQGIGSSAFSGCTSLKEMAFPPAIRSIGQSAFENCSSFVSITIPEHISNINSFAFRGCSSLREATLPSKMTGYWALGSSAFADCTALEKVELPNAMTHIPSSLFDGCVSLSSVEIPSSVVNIGNSAFRGCTALNKVDLPKGLTYLGSSAFSDCSSLQTIIIPESITMLNSSTFKNCTSLRQLTLPKTVAKSDYYFKSSEFAGCTSLTFVDLPEGFRIIPDTLFKGCTSLTEVKVPSSVEQISLDAFRDCVSLSSINLDGITAIGQSAFRNCSSLKEVTVPANLGSFAFADCVFLQNVHLPEEVEDYHFYDNVFNNCTNLKQVVLPQGLKTIPRHMFYNCTGLERIEIPASVIELETCAFCKCYNLSEVKFNVGLKSINQGAFADCYSLTSIKLPDGLESIAYLSFANTALREVIIPDSVTNLAGAFSGCGFLTKVVLGEGITYLNFTVFSGTSLKELYVKGRITNQIHWSTEGHVDDLRYIYYAHSESQWPGFDKILPDDFESITVYFNWVPGEEGEVYSLKREQAEEKLEASETEPPATEPPTTEPPVTEPPVTEPPVTEPPVTEALEDSNSEQEQDKQSTENTEETESTKEPLVATALVSSANNGGRTHRVSLLSNVTNGNVINEDGGMISVSYTDLTPGRQYLLLMLTDAESPITSDNLLYIDQKAANQDGTLSFRFTPRITNTGSSPQLIGAKSYNHPILGVESADEYDDFYVDGKPIKNLSVGVPNKDAVLLTAYRNVTSEADGIAPPEFKQYPVSMDVWKLTYKEDTSSYQAEKIDALHDLFQYNGCSIRIVGVKGIRMLTSITKSARDELLNSSIAGYTLEEYGTVVGWQTEVDANNGSLTLEDSYAKSNYAYSRSKGQDAIFANITDSATGQPRVQYTNVLVGFSDEQCKQSLCMRPYMILRDADGQSVTLYGGIVTRSIGYIARQNANAFAKGTAAYDYVHHIINYCYPAV